MGRSPIPAGSRDTRTPGVTNRLLLSHSSGRAFSGFPMRKAVEKAQAFLSEMILTHSETSALVLGSEDMFRDTSWCLPSTETLLETSGDCSLMDSINMY